MIGDMFATHFDVRVNPVNCVGVMGAGLARRFKLRYPAMFLDYRQACPLVPGQLHIWSNANECVVNLPTKVDWRAASTYEYVELGLDSLCNYLSTLLPVRVAIPALGCGLGGLSWRVVSKIIKKKLADVSYHHIQLFGRDDASEQVP